MKKFKRVMLIIVTLIALIAFANISIKIYSSYKNDKYEDTVLPENLTAEET